MRKNPSHMISKLMSLFSWFFLKLFYFNIHITAKTIPRIYGKVNLIGENGSISLGSNLEIHSMSFFLGSNFFGKLECGDNCIFSERTIIAPREGNIVIGNKVFIGQNVLIQAWKDGDITIGESTMIAKDVNILSSNHDLDSYGYREEIGREIYIGKNVWIGASAVILPGIKIGDNAVIGAGSVVTKDIPSFCMFVGNPAKLVKKYNHDLKSWEKV